MPGFTTHYLFGQQTYQNLCPSRLKQAIQKYHTVFALGLQGPDIFFYHIPSLLLKEKNPGSIAHVLSTGQFLRHLLESPRSFPAGSERDVAISYVYGFIGHYLLDAACHPYVYARTRFGFRGKGYMGCHIRLETDIDTCLLWHYLHRHPSEFHQDESIALSRKQMEVVSSILYAAFRKTYPKLALSRATILRAICAIRRETRLLHDPSGCKKALIRRIESVFPGYPMLSPLIPSDTLIFYRDPCNMRHNLWRNPWDAEKVSTESFYDLFEKAQAEYAGLLNDVACFFAQKHAPGEEAHMLASLLRRLGNRSYHSGLSVT